VEIRLSYGKRHEMSPLSIGSTFDKEKRILVVKISGQMSAFTEALKILDEIEAIFARLPSEKVWLVSDYSDFDRHQKFSFSIITAKIFARLNRILHGRTIDRIIVTRGDSNILIYEKLLASLIGGSPKHFATLDDALSYIDTATGDLDKV
jgi:hypothetical protein